MVAGTLIKFIPVLLIPAALLIGYLSLENFKSRLWFIVKTSLAGAFLIVIAYIPFWNGMATFSITRRMQMFTTSIPAVIYKILKPALGWSEAARLVSLGALGLLAIFTLIQTFRLQKQEAHQRLSPNRVQHPRLLFAGNLPVVSTMVWHLVDQPRTIIAGAQPPICPRLWILGYE